MIHKMNIKSKHPHGFLLPQGIGVLTFGILGLRVTGSILLSVSFLYPKSWEQKSTRALSQCHRRQEVQQRNTSTVPSASQHDYKLKQTCTSKKCLTTGRGQGDTKSLFKLNSNMKSFFVVVRHKRKRLWESCSFLQRLCLSVTLQGVGERVPGLQAWKCAREGGEFIWKLPQGPVKRGNAGTGGLRKGSGAGQG